MLIKKLKHDFKFEDDRGSLIQLVHEGFRQVNYVLSEKGAVRGNFHYHEINNEAFFVISGKILVTLKYNGITEEHLFCCGDMFMIEKKIGHKLEFIEKSELIVFYDVGIELADGKKDIIEW